MSPPLDISHGPEGPWLDEEVSTFEDQPAGSAGSLVNLGFIRAAVRRSAWFWCLTAVIGLLVGSGLYMRSADNHQASTELLLTVGPEPQPGVAILEDQAIAQSQAEAGLAVQKLGLHQSVASFLRSFTVTVLTDRILVITANAPSSTEAVRRASVLATEFLAFRADQLRAEQRLEFAALDQQVAGEREKLASINKQISLVSVLPASSSTLAKLGALKEQADRASQDLTALQQAASTSKASIDVSTATMIGGSKVLDSASPVPQKSRTKRLLLYVGGALLIGLILGMSIVVVGAIVSERLRRRDDVAHALGAPVKSVAAVRGRRWLPARGKRDAGSYSERIAQYLRDALAADPHRLAALAVVPVGEPRVAATSVASLAESCARAGTQVVVADLSAGALAATALGIKNPGVCTIGVDGAHIVVAVPDPVEFLPVGPFRHPSRSARSSFEKALAAACKSADLLLTLIPLDPSVGAEHLGTWAADAVVIVTAGQSTWTKIHAVGEMIRSAGTRLAFGVLVAADKTDESLGVTRARLAGHQTVSIWPAEADLGRNFATSPRGSAPDSSAVPVAHLNPHERADHLHRGE